MEDLLRMINDLVARTTGPMSFRLILQPVMASIFAILGGLKDAKAGKPPFLWTIFTDPAARRDLLRDGWKHIGNVFILAVVLDVVYQFIVQRFVYPFEVIVVAFVLAIVPYIILRGLVNRITCGDKAFETDE
jgi:hypothetical protein